MTLKRTGLPKRNKPLERRPFKRKRRRWTGANAASKFWHDTVTSGGCVMAGEHFGRVTGHHVITKNRLKREGLAAHLWDTRNGVGLCELHHAQHHAHRERLPRELLSPGVFSFAEEHGLGHVLDREYPVREGAA